MLLFPTMFSAFPQKTSLNFRTQQSRLEKELESTGSLIDKARDTKHTTLTDIAILQSSIRGRQQLIMTYQAEQRKLYDTIFSNLLYINTLKEKTDLLRQEYGRMIYSTYRQSGEENLLLFLLAAENLQQAYNRLNWFRSYSEKRKEQVASIEELEEKYASMERFIKTFASEIMLTTLKDNSIITINPEIIKTLKDALSQMED